MKTINIPIVYIILSSFPATAFCQDYSSSIHKANALQIISYKPPRAKSGKNGSERIAVIQIIKGPKSGKDGQEGKAGPNLKAGIASIQIGDTNLLRIIVTQVSNNNKPDTFYTNPRFGQIKLIADGGDGGNGGQGEAKGGSPGSGGKGGMGGQIKVLFDSSALAYMNCKCLVFSNEGGMGGWSGENYGKAGEPGSKGPPIYFMAPNGKIIR